SDLFDNYNAAGAKVFTVPVSALGAPAGGFDANGNNDGGDSVAVAVNDVFYVAGLTQDWHQHRLTSTGLQPFVSFVAIPQADAIPQGVHVVSDRAGYNVEYFAAGFSPGTTASDPDVVNGGVSNVTGTFVTALNNTGEAVGYYTTTADVNPHGFIF